MIARKALPTFLVLLCGSFLLAQEPWAERGPSEWTLEDLEKVLWDSPWVEKKRFRFFGRYGSRYRVHFFVRIQSAEPVRLAMAKVVEVLPDRFTRHVGPIDTETVRKRAEELRFPGELVFSLVASPPLIHRYLDRLSQEGMAEQTLLTINGRSEYPLKRYHPPMETEHGEAIFRFRRPPAEELNGEINFSTRVKIPHEVKVEVEFDLDNLFYRDAPAY